MLLEREITVDSNEDVKFALRQSQELAVCDAAPSMLRDSGHVYPTQVTGQVAVYTLVE